MVLQALPVAQLPAPDLNAFIFPKVELYQTCPATGLLGSLETV